MEQGAEAHTVKPVAAEVGVSGAVTRLLYLRYSELPELCVSADLVSITVRRTGSDVATAVNDACGMRVNSGP